MENYLEKKMGRSNSGDLRNDFENSQYWSDEMWKSKMQGGGGNKKIFQYRTDPPGQEILYLRALQGHLGRNPIDPTLQDNVLIPNNFFEYIYHLGCAISLHSITNSGLIAGGQISSRERQTVFFTAVNPMDKDHKDPHELVVTVRNGKVVFGRTRDLVKIGTCRFGSRSPCQGNFPLVCEDVARFMECQSDVLCAMLLYMFVNWCTENHQ